MSDQSHFFFLQTLYNSSAYFKYLWPDTLPQSHEWKSIQTWFFLQKCVSISRKNIIPEVQIKQFGSYLVSDWNVMVYCLDIFVKDFCILWQSCLTKSAWKTTVPWMLPLGWGLKQWVKTPKAVPDKKNWHLFYAYLQSNWQGWEDTSTGGSSPAALGWSP